MTDGQRERIHAILYSDDSREELAERIVRLEDKRDKLRKENDYLLMNANPTATELRRVRRAWKNDRDENTKLRELIRDYDKCLDTALHLAGKAGYPHMPDGHLFESLSPRMRELGIEVGK